MDVNWETDYEEPELRCVPRSADEGGCNGCRTLGVKTLHFRCEGPGGTTVLRLCRKCILKQLSAIRSFVR